MGRGTTKETLVVEITDFYLKSREFNGLPLREVRMKQDRLKAILRELIDDGKVSLVFGDVHPNPHVKAFEAEPAEKQLEKMERLTLADACAYPTPAHLARVIDRNQHRDAPFTLELYLGAPQLKPYFFDWPCSRPTGTTPAITTGWTISAAVSVSATSTPFRRQGRCARRTSCFCNASASATTRR